jgi:hypothetical protein
VADPEVEPVVGLHPLVHPEHLVLENLQLSSGEPVAVVEEPHFSVELVLDQEVL